MKFSWFHECFFHRGGYHHYFIKVVCLQENLGILWNLRKFLACGNFYCCQHWCYNIQFWSMQIYVNHCCSMLIKSNQCESTHWALTWLRKIDPVWSAMIGNDLYWVAIPEIWSFLIGIEWYTAWIVYYQTVHPRNSCQMVILATGVWCMVRFQLCMGIDPSCLKYYSHRYVKL